MTSFMVVPSQYKGGGVWVWVAFLLLSTLTFHTLMEIDINITFVVLLVLLLDFV